tara:strand:- start:4005 stop:5099 length:1095 start_codon:yes stop_codon:yes gene_type:complete
MSKTPIRILLTGGGSGGPTLPLLALAEEIIMKREDSIFLFLGRKKGLERQIVKQAGIAYEHIPSGKLRRYFSWQNFVDPIFIIGGAVSGFLKLLSFRPHIIVSAGSFVSVPVAYMSWILGIPHVIFQMDVRPGLANRLMAPVSHALITYFEKTSNHFPKIFLKKNIGPVVRKEIINGNAEQANYQFGLDSKIPLILITGGGQGASGLNNAVMPMLKHLLINFQVVHLTGSKWEENIENKYSDFSHHHYHRITAVNQGMGNLLAKSEIVFSRAGMGIIGELAYLRKDSVLIPIPGTHQEENALILQNNKAAVCVSQEHLETEGIKWWEKFILKRTPGEMGARLNRILPDGGTSDFAKMILDIAKK